MSTRRFIAIHKNELQVIRDTQGAATPPFLSASLACLRSELERDTQLIEAGNKKIQFECRRSPQISWPLLSARHTTHHAIFEEAGEVATETKVGSQKWC